MYYIYTHTLTINGCEIEERISFSLLTCSTCFNRMTSLIVIIFNAKKLLVGRCLASTTLPNVPVPVCVWSGERGWGKRQRGREGGGEGRV